jgi:hypothetical protein
MDAPRRGRAKGGSPASGDGAWLQGGVLGIEQLLDSVASESQERLELDGREGGLLAGTLEFDEIAGAGHDEIQIDLGADVFFVGEIEARFIIDESDAEGGDGVEDRGGIEASGGQELLDGECECDVSAGDGGGAGASVSLQHIAIDPERACAEPGEIDGGAHGSADEPLDFLGAAIEAAAGDITGFTLQGGIGQHGVLGGDPAAGHALFFHPARDGIFNGDGTDDTSAAALDEGGSVGIGGDVVGETDRAELVRPAGVGARGGWGGGGGVAHAGSG